MRAALCLLLGTVPVLAQQHIAPTEAKSPAEEQKSFTVPPGFAVQLVAAEPDIGKPMQIAWDARGRLWVTTSHAYPFPSADAKDRLFVLSDFAADGKARKVEVFANDLNIPIGVLPLPDCKSVLVSEVGRILKLSDTDGDGTADKKDVLFTGFGTRDTHGMTNSFTPMADGWVYACHGFSNESRVKGTDGHEVVMQSGHTFRFRPDGSRIEVYTRGQVNPFGMTADPWFNLYTADCHSKPITQLIPGAYYDSFGKPHDGLGYAPHVTRHDHGSTALCGLAWYEAAQYPKEFCGNMFLGNVVTNRVNRDRIDWKGSTPVAVEQPDFVTSTDPWFRPTDIKLGPDGALYIADFYNRIIGHYEVDLKHPLRDKDRGRIWRVVYVGEPGASATGGGAGTTNAFANLTLESPDQLFARLSSENIAVRNAALLELTRRGLTRPQSPEGAMPRSLPQPGQDLTVLLDTMDRFPAGWENWIGEYTEKTLKSSGSDRVKVYTLKQVAAQPRLSRNQRDAVLRCLPELGPVTLRAAVDVLAKFPAKENVPALDEIVPRIGADDSHLRHAARVALRNSLAAPGGFDGAKPSAVLADAALAVPTFDAAKYLLSDMKARGPNPEAVRHIARHGAVLRAELAAHLAAEGTSLARRIELARALVRGLQEAGGAFAAEDRAYVAALTAESVRARDAGAIVGCAELATASKAEAAVRTLSDVYGDGNYPAAVRAAALTALWGDDARRPLVFAAAVNESAPREIREKALSLAVPRSPQEREAFLNAVRVASAQYAVEYAKGLAATPAGAEALFGAVKDGKASPRLLQEKAVLDRLKVAKIANSETRVRELTAGLPSAEAKLTAAIAARVKDYPKSAPNIEAGKKLYATHCAACHQIAGAGGKVGPNLDGIGARGPDRLFEDVLDPNRNVDAAFRATTLSLADGRVLTGLLLREEGAVLVLADAEGKEQRLPKADVEKRTLSNQSPMPANWAEKLKPEETRDLIGYLAGLKVK